jgi:hypothetical protein
MAVIPRASASPSENMIMVRNLKKNIGYERAVSEKSRCGVHEVIKQLGALNLQSFEA